MSIIHTFTIASVSYDANADDLSIRAFISRVTYTNVDGSPDESFETETYANADASTTVVKISFNVADMIISFDCEVFDVPNTYLPTVLLAFANAFDDAYASLDHTASPIDAFENLKTFDLEM